LRAIDANIVSLFIYPSVWPV